MSGCRGLADVETGDGLAGHVVVGVDDKHRLVDALDFSVGHLARLRRGGKDRGDGAEDGRGAGEGHVEGYSNILPQQNRSLTAAAPQTRSGSPSAPAAPRA